MISTTIETPAGPISLLQSEAPRIDSVDVFLDTLFSVEASTLAISADSIDPRFFDLSTGFAGDILQKVTNYGRRLVILGDFTGIESKSLRSLIAECNRSGQVVFAGSVDSAAALLR